MANPYFRTRSPPKSHKSDRRTCTSAVCNDDRRICVRDGAAINGDHCLVKGRRCVVNGDHCYVEGSDCTINGDHCYGPGISTARRINGRYCASSGTVSDDPLPPPDVDIRVVPHERTVYIGRDMASALAGSDHDIYMDNVRIDNDEHGARVTMGNNYGIYIGRSVSSTPTPAHAAAAAALARRTIVPTPPPPEPKKAERKRPEPPSGPVEEAKEGEECSVCLTAKRDTACLPCGHMCMCYACAYTVIEDSARADKKCPICAGKLADISRIYV